MKKILTILVLLLAFAPLVAAAGPTKLAVTEIKVRRGVDPVIARVVEEFLANETSRLAVFQVIGRDDIQRMFDHEQQKQMVGCDEDSCLAEIGGALGVDLLLAGSMDKVGETTLISLKLINIRTAEVTRRESGRLRGATEEDAIDAVAILFRQLFKPELKAQEPKRLWTWVATGAAGALAVTGAVLVGVGYADDAEAQRLADGSTSTSTYYSEVTKIEEKSRSEKIAGGVILGVGGAAAVTALLLYFFEVEEPALAVAPVLSGDLTFTGVSIGGTF